MYFLSQKRCHHYSANILICIAFQCFFAGYFSRKRDKILSVSQMVIFLFVGLQKPLSNFVLKCKLSISLIMN